MDYLNDPRFTGIKPLENKVWLSSPTIHDLERVYVKSAFDMIEA